MRSMRVRTTVVGILFLATMVGVAAPANAGWLRHADEKRVGDRLLRAETSDLVRWGKAVSGTRRRANVTYSRSKASVDPGTDHLCLRSTFVGVGKDVRVEVSANEGHITTNDRRATVTFRSCGSSVRSIETQYLQVSFFATKLRRVMHTMRVDASSAAPSYVGSFNTRHSQLATQPGGDGPPSPEECGV